MGMMGPRKSVEQKVGHSMNTPDGYSEKPYGRCYGQVCGVSYPCTQRTPEDERTAVPSKSEYAKKRRAHNAKRVRCVETGEEFGSLREASERFGLCETYFGKCVSNGRAVDGVHFEVLV